MQPQSGGSLSHGGDEIISTGLVHQIPLERLWGLRRCRIKLSSISEGMTAENYIFRPHFCASPLEWVGGWLISSLWQLGNLANYFSLIDLRCQA